MVATPLPKPNATPKKPNLVILRNVTYSQIGHRNCIFGVYRPVFGGPSTCEIGS